MINLSEYLKHQQRTADFFKQDYRELAGSLERVYIAIPRTPIRLQVSEAEPFPISANVRGVYRPLLEMDPGHVYPCFVQGKLITLVSALEDGQRGACVKLNKASRVIDGKNVEIKRPSHVTAALELLPREEPRPFLAFLNRTATLYLLRPGNLGRIDSGENLPTVDPDVASEAWESYTSL